MKRLSLFLSLLGLISIGPKSAYADMPALCFDSACTAGIQIPGIDDWRQTNIYFGNNGTFGAGVEGAFSHQWHFESFLVGVGSPSNGASTFNGAVTEDLDLIGMLHSFNDGTYVWVTDAVAENVELSPFYGYQFVNAGQIYGVKFNLKF